MSKYEVGAAPDMLWQAAGDRIASQVKAGKAGMRRAWMDAWGPLFIETSRLLSAYAIPATATMEPKLSVAPVPDEPRWLVVSPDADRFELCARWRDERRAGAKGEPLVMGGPATWTEPFTLADASALRWEPHANVIVSPHGNTIEILIARILSQEHFPRPPSPADEIARHFAFLNV